MVKKAQPGTEERNLYSDPSISLLLYRRDASFLCVVTVTADHATPLVASAGTASRLEPDHTRACSTQVTSPMIAAAQDALPEKNMLFAKVEVEHHRD